MSRIASAAGVVSLFDMLDFYARPYLELTHKFGKLLALGQPADPNVVKDVWGDLLTDTTRLNLPITKELIVELFEEFAKANPTKISKTSEGIAILGAELPYVRMAHHCESIYKTLKAELSSLQLRAIPREKAKYCAPAWLTDTTMFTKYPDTVDEFQKAGRCFAYGENTACVFHLMRVSEFYFTKVAQSLQADFDPLNWGEIAKLINRKMETKHQTKTEDWRAAEPFYAEILCDLQALGRAHRNPALHDLAVIYDDRQGQRMLEIVEAFCSHVAETL
jgi:hypothetical protein